MRYFTTKSIDNQQQLAIRYTKTLVMIDTVCIILQRYFCIDSFLSWFMLVFEKSFLSSSSSRIFFSFSFYFAFNKIILVFILFFVHMIIIFI